MTYKVWGKNSTVSKTGSVIEINGTRYGADGAVSGSIRKVANQVKTIDGFVRKAKAVSTKSANNKIRKIVNRPTSQAKSAKQVHSRAQKSHALMRTVVERPKAQKPLRRKLIKPSLSKVVEVEQERRSRASAITRDRQVNRFGSPQPAKVSRPEIIAKARPMQKVSAGNATTAPIPPSMVASASHQRLERMLDEALIRADAHKQMIKSRSKNPLNHLGKIPRWLAVTIMIILLILLAAFFAWRSMPAVAIKVASQEAHVNASLPSYAPVGYSIAGSVGHAGSKVIINYQSTGNSALGYSISQQSSTWDSASLAANVLGNKADAQTSQVQGTTVYIYGKQNNATWVNNGVWYTLKNNASLTSDQILHIVQSM